MRRFVAIFTLFILLSASLPVLAGNTCETAIPFNGFDGNFGTLTVGEEFWFTASGGLLDTWEIYLDLSGFTLDVLVGDCASPTVLAGPFIGEGYYPLSEEAEDIYYIRVIGNSDCLGYYRFSLEEEDNNSCGDGILMSVGDYIDDTLDYEGDEDWVQVSLTGGVEVQFVAQRRDGLVYPPCRITFSTEPTCHPYSWTSIGYQGEQGTVAAFTPPETGVYYLYIHTFSEPRVGAYRLYVDIYGTVGSEPMDWGFLKAIYR